MDNKEYEKLSKYKTSEKINDGLDDHPFLHIHESNDKPIFYIGDIRKLSSSLVVVELKDEGKNLLNIDTIIKLKEITIERNKNLSIKNFQFFESYFIMEKYFVSKLFILSAIDTLLDKNKKAVIGIDGNAASGKTTLASLIKNIYDCNIFHVDNYFQKPVSHLNDELSKYASNIHFKRMETEIFSPAKNEQTSKIKLMDLKTHTLSDVKIVNYKSLSIVEGAYSMHPYIIKNYDLKVYMKTTYINQLFRIWKRNGFKKLIQFIKKWIPMENRYFHDLDIENQADIIIKG